MNDLEKLGIKYGTDKATKHHYLDVYYDLFKDRRNEVEKVLEIGVGEGAGLRMFRDFFPNAMICGADNDLMRIFTAERIEVIKCDQSDETDLVNLSANVGIDIDLVIDDGSHKPEDQLFTCLTLMPLLNKNVTYVIEDVADLSIVEPISKEYSTNIVECGKRYDDRLVIVGKRP